MSSVTPDAESFVVINRDGSRSGHAKTAEGQQLPSSLTNMPKPIVTFYQGQPEALGAAQIFVGVLSIALGVTFTIAFMYHMWVMSVVIFSGVLFWSGIAYIVSGSLSVAASAKPSLGKVRSSLVLNIISSVLGGVAIILLSINLIPQFSYNGVLCVYTGSPDTCEDSLDINAFMYGILGVHFILVLLIFSITISTSVFACRTVCRSSYQDVTVVVYQTPMIASPALCDGVPGVQERVNRQ